MPKCAAIGCKNINDRNRRTQHQVDLETKVKLTFHNFPKNPQRRKAWVDAMQLGDWQPTSGSYLCSLHFEDKFFDGTSLVKTRLHNNAIPHVSRPPKREYPDDFAKDIDNTTTESCSTNKKPIFVDRCTSVSPDRFIEHSEKPKTVDRATSVSPPRIFNSPTKQRIRASNKMAIEDYKKKVKSVQDKLRNKDKKMPRMRSILKTLKEKKFMSDTEFDMLKCLGKSNEHLLARQLRKAKNLPVDKQYSPELRTFALTLHYYSSRAYAYVGKKFNTCLPHPKTIFKWYRSVNGKPGLNSEAFECIKERFSTIFFARCLNV